MQWTLAKLSEALHVAASFTYAHKPITGFSIDSRTVKPGEVFLAIKGPRYDGHDFVSEALNKGAIAAVVSEERRMTYPPDMFKKLVGVLDTFQALQQLGRFARQAWGRALIGVTGSTGKTTTKDLLAALLATRHKVLRSEGNLNNEYGVPLTLLRLRPQHEVAVLEMAMTRKGELAKLCAVASPNIGLVTNVAPVHLEFFGSVEEIAEAKRELIQNLAPPAVAVLNADDARVRRFDDGFTGKVYRFGMENPAEVRVENIADRGLAGSEFDLVLGQKRARVRLSLPGRAHIGNALAASAAASLLKIEPADAVPVFAGVEPQPLRGQRVQFAPGFTVVDDAYNCNPRALTLMAEALGRTPEAKRRLLVAGEMKELGPTSAELHRQVGQTIASPGTVDFLAGVTGDARYLVEGARAAGLPADRAQFFDSKEAAADWLLDALQPGDWVLLKASRAVALETVLDALRDRFAVESVSATKGRD